MGNKETVVPLKLTNWGDTEVTMMANRFYDVIDGERHRRLASFAPGPYIKKGDETYARRNAERHSAQPERPDATFMVNGKKVCICTWGDNRAELDRNIAYFHKMQPGYCSRKV